MTEPTTSLTAINVRDFFTQRIGTSTDPRFANLSGTLRFDIEGEGSWRLSIDHGSLKLEESQKPADSTMRIKGSDLLEILNHRKNIVTTFLRGDLVVEGNRGLAAGAINFFSKAA